MATLRVLGAIRDVPREAWDALLPLDASPFVEWTWLAALEEAGTVGEATGWLPQHLTVWEGTQLIGACPLYVKHHGQGEFVFDHAWAHGARRAGIAYYPKLLVAVPFTPVTGARLLARAADHATVAAMLAEALERLCSAGGYSSAHVNFCLPRDGDALASRGWLRRTGYQYHWVNDGYCSFEDYLASLRSKRRNQVRREERELDAQGIAIETLVGDAIPGELVPVMYRLYRHQVRQFGPWGHLYLNARVFELVWEGWRGRLCFIVARRAGQVVGGTVNVQAGGVLYGRYWGAFEALRHLHFNVCYYAAIRHCIAAGLRRFEPGAGGEFKHLRGFDARMTESVHFIADPRLRHAVAEYLVHERAEVAAEVALFGRHTALRRDGGPDRG